MFARLDVGQKRVLLRLVEAVNLVDEDDGAAAVLLALARASAITCLDFLDAGQHRDERDELAPWSCGR